MPRPPRTLLRRLAAVLAAAQLAAFALAPVVEAATERAPGPPSLEAPHGSCARVHQPATCLACVLLAARARTPERVHLSVPETERHVPETAALALAPTQAAPRALRTRAPPPLAA